jgi:hypothetical protein
MDRGEPTPLARWETSEDARQAGRPPRRYYHLAALGQSRAVHALGSSAAQRRTLARFLDAVDPSPRPGLLEGT